MKPRPTIRDLAIAAGVSIGTASRVINGTASVSSAIRKKVEAAIQSLGYEPNTIAQSMRRGASRTVGLIIRDITMAPLAGFMKAAQERFERAGYALVIVWTEHQKDRELMLLNVLLRRQVDGLIVMTSSEEDKDLLQAHASVQIPTVLFDRETPTSSDAVMVAHHDGVFRAVDYLADLGHRRIAMVTGNPGVYPTRARIAGYTDALKKRSLPVDPSCLRVGSFSGEFSFLETSAMLGSSRPPTAIVAGGISSLPGVLRAVKMHGLSIPHDISVVGGSSSDLSLFTTPAVTTIEWDYAEMGAAAATLLLKRISFRANNDTEAPEISRVIFPANLIVRESCAPPKRPA